MEENYRELDYVPYDHSFITDNGNEELCHATGYEWFDGSRWWNEYEDSEGNLYYGG